MRDLGDHRLKGIPQPERLFQLVAPGLRFDFPPLEAQRLGNLPIPRTPIVGRREESEHILEALRSTPVLTLTGPGGIGKTRLAVEVARTVAPVVRRRRVLRPLAAVDDPLAVPAVVVRTLGLQRGARRIAADALARGLRDRELLLLLDNFERVIAAAPLVADLIEACPRLTVLTTSRERLHLADETEYAVPSLEHDAVPLFLARARAAACTGARTRRARGHSRDLPAARGPAARDRAGGCRVRLLPLSEILARLEQRLAFLTGGPQDLPARQQTLAATIDWSYALLEPDEQAALKQLAVFAGGFSPRRLWWCAVTMKPLFACSRRSATRA